jgi:hypothetical protein
MDAEALQGLNTSPCLLVALLFLFHVWLLSIADRILRLGRDLHQEKAAKKPVK